MSVLKALTVSINKYVEQFCMKIVEKQNENHHFTVEELMELWGSEPKVVKNRKTTPKTEKEETKKCSYVFGEKSEKHGQECGVKVSGEGNFCSRHVPKEKKEKKEVKEKKEKKEKEKKEPTVIKKVKGKETKISKNKDGFFVADGLIFDKDVKDKPFVLGRYEEALNPTEKGKMVELTEEDINLCKQKGYHFNVPENLKIQKNNVEKESENEETENDDDIETEEEEESDEE
jgi:hypothetical protein